MIKQITIDEIYGMDIDEYCDRHSISINDLIQKTETDIEILRERLRYLVYDKDLLIDEVTNAVENMLDKKRKHLKRLQDWKKIKRVKNEK